MDCIKTKSLYITSSHSILLGKACLCKMKYYFYQGGSGDLFFGTTRDELTRTLKYIRDRSGEQDGIIPPASEFSKLEKICVTVDFPLLSPEQYIRAEVRKNVVFSVNANAFDHIQRSLEAYARDKNKFKWGTLYALNTGSFWCLLPGCIMESLRRYNWDQHRAQVEKWLSDREKKLCELERNCALERPRPGLN